MRRQNWALLAAMAGAMPLLVGCDGSENAPTAVAPAASTSASSETAPSAVNLSGVQTAQAAMENGTYFVGVLHKDGAGIEGVASVVQETVEAASEKAAWASIDLFDATAVAFAAQYGFDRLPVPAVVVLAPNGAVTATLLPTADEPIQKEDVLAGFVTPGQAGMLKAFQDGMVAAIDYRVTDDASEAAAVELFSDEELAAAIVRVHVSPDDASESAFMASFDLGDKLTTPSVLLLAPPGTLIAHFAAEPEKVKIKSEVDQFLATPG